MTLQPVPSTQLEAAPGANPMQRFDNSEDKRESHSFLKDQTLREGSQPHPHPLCADSYVLLHFLAQLLALPALWLHQVLCEEPCQPQRQPVGNWKEKFPTLTTQPTAGRVVSRSHTANSQTPSSTSPEDHRNGFGGDIMATGGKPPRLRVLQHLLQALLLTSVTY